MSKTNTVANDDRKPAKRRGARHKALGKPDVYQRVTDQIVAALEKGVRPWMKPWSVEHAAGRVSRPLRHGGEPYQGVNVLMLWAAAGERGFASPYWLTFRQAQQLDACVKKGEKGTQVVYCGSFTKQETNEQGEEVESKIPFLKTYTVFNGEQIAGLPLRYLIPAEPLEQGHKQIKEAKRFFAATGADIRNGGNRAYYSDALDYIQMPPFSCFRDAESHAATLAHELCHWTKHPSRLDRGFGERRFGDAGYAMEELVAELGAAFLCADLGVTPEVRDDHASYLGHWLEVLKQDKRAIFTAASHASRAVGYLHELQTEAHR